MSEWIPVTEKLPPACEEVVTYRGSSTGYSIERYFPEVAEWRFDQLVEGAVTHWMPLPEAPHDE